MSSPAPDPAAPSPPAPAVGPSTPAVGPSTPPVDAATPPVDAATPPVDTGPPSVDTGTPSVDTGTPAVDAGTPPVDAGTPSVDAGAPPVDAAAFRRVVGRYATGVTVVTACLDGIDHAMTANAFTSVSLDPVLVLVCVEKEARFHDAITATGLWGVSVLDGTARRAAEWFATRGRPLIGQLEPYARHRGPHTGAQLLDQAIATMECRTWATYDGGDHSIVVGEVLALDLAQPEGDPLLYYRSAYHHLG